MGYHTARRFFANLRDVFGIVLGARLVVLNGNKQAALLSYVRLPTVPTEIRKVGKKFVLRAK